MALSIIRAMNVKRAINTWTRILFIYSYPFSHSLLYYFTFDKYEATQETYDLLPVTMTNTVTVTCNIWNNLCRSRTQGLPRNFQFAWKLSSVSGNFLTYNWGQNRPFGDPTIPFGDPNWPFCDPIRPFGDPTCPFWGPTRPFELSRPLTDRGDPKGQNKLACSYIPEIYRSILIPLGLGPLIYGDKW